MSAASLHDVLVAARERLVASGHAAASADVDVEVLARHLLGWDRATLLVRRRDASPEHLAGALASLVARRAAREPVAYITGHREFWGLDFEVTSDVLVPRPETEIVVEEALRVLASPRPEGRRRQVLDVGTGSGCLAVTIATKADVDVVATDVSPRALRVAARNAHRLGAVVRFIAADLLRPLRRSAPWVDVLVANPPYVPRGATNVMSDVARHEPSLALYGGADGLELLRPLVAQAADLVRPGGWLISEFGDGQDDAVAAVIAASPGWSLVGIRRDLQDIARVVVARRHE